MERCPAEMIRTLDVRERSCADVGEEVEEFGAGSVRRSWGGESEDVEVEGKVLLWVG